MIRFIRSLFSQKQPSEGYCKKRILTNFLWILWILTKFTGVHLCRSLFFNKVPGQACKFIKQRLQHSCFPVCFAKFLRASILQDICERVLLFILFNFAYVVIDNKIHSDCFHDDQSEGLFFTTSAFGIQRNISCTYNCNCNETTKGYCTVNCPLCYCQKRVTCRVVNRGRFKWFILLASFSSFCNNLDLYLAILKSFELLKMNLFQNHIIIFILWYSDVTPLRKKP